LSVSDDAAAALMSNLFEISKTKSNLSHGETLKEASLNLLNNAKTKSSYTRGVARATDRRDCEEALVAK